MASTSRITISLKRKIEPSDEKIVNYLMSQWLVYDAKIERHWSGTEISLFHTEGAKRDLLNELERFFPGESSLGM